MRTRTAAPLAAVALVTVALVVGYAVHDGNGSGPATPPAAVPTVLVPTPTTSRAPALAPLPGTAALPTPADVATLLRQASNAPGLGRSLAGVVVDVATGRTLWRHGATVASTPASTTKLLTATAALHVLGPSYRLTTATAVSGRTVYVVGGGDVTLTRTPQRGGYPRPATMADLAAQTAAALRATAGAQPRVRVRLDTTAWSGPGRAVGWSPRYVREGDVTPPAALELDGGRVAGGLGDTTRVKDPAAQAGSAFVTLLRHDGVVVRGQATSGTTPSNATRLATVASPPLATLVQRMLTRSDNDLAEALGRTLARHDRLPATFTGAAQAVLAGLRPLGVPTTGVVLHDTSGLSHLDRIPPATLVAAIRLAAGPAHPDLRAVIEGLPVAGATGTLANRYHHGVAVAGAGVLRAKTGTLTGVSTLAGLVTDRSGRLLAFALMASHAPGTSLAESALDALASRLVSCGCATA